MADVQMGAKKGTGFYVGWIGLPVLALTGVVAAIAKGSPALGVVSGVAVAALTYILLRRFAK